MTGRWRVRPDESGEAEVDKSDKVSPGHRGRLWCRLRPTATTTDQCAVTNTGRRGVLASESVAAGLFRVEVLTRDSAYGAPGPVQASDAAGSRPIAPIRMSVVRHRFVNECVKVGIVLLQSLACADRVGDLIGDCVPSAGIEVGEHACNPIFHTILPGWGSFPQTFVRRGLVKLLEFLVELNIEPFHA